MIDENDTSGHDRKARKRDPNTDRGPMSQSQLSQANGRHVLNVSTNGNGVDGGGIHIPWKPLTAEETTALKTHTDAMYPDDEDFAEIDPSPEDFLFWRSHPRLWNCYVHAQAIGRSPSVLLMLRLLRIASVIPPEYTTGDIGAGYVSLDMVVVPYGESGSGKTTLKNAARYAIPLETEVLQIAGFNKAGMRDAIAATGDRGDTIRTGYNISAFIDEGEVLESAGKQGGNDLLPTLRALAHGQSSVLSTANAKGGVGLVLIEDMSLRFTAAVNMQQSHVPYLFNDKRINDGTLQRLMFVDAEERYVRRRKNRPAVPSPLENVIPRDLLLPGMNSVGVVDASKALIAGADSHVVSSLLNRPKPRQSAVPDALIRYVERATLARATKRRTEKERNAQAQQSHRIVDVGRLSTLLAIYLDSVFDPTDDHVESALYLIRFLDRTVAKVAADIKRMKNKVAKDVGETRGHEKVAERRVVQTANDFQATVSKVVDVMRKLRIESGDMDLETKTNELRRKCRVRGENTHFDAAVDYLVAKKRISKRPGSRSDSFLVKLVSNSDDDVEEWESE